MVISKRKEIINRAYNVYKGKIILIEELIKEYIIQKKNFSQIIPFNLKKVDLYEKQIKSSKQPLFFICGYLFNNYSPTLSELSKKFDLFILTLNNQLPYASENSSIKNFKYGNIFHLSLNEFLYIIPKLSQGIAIINDASFIRPGFDGVKAYINFTFVNYIQKLLKIKNIIILYDLIHSVLNNKKWLEKYFAKYKHVIKYSDGIICSSNTEEAHNVIKNILRYKKPIISFYRYNFYVPNIQKKINKGFHIVLIYGIDDKLRDSTFMLKQLLNQKIHIHCYVKSSFVEKMYNFLNDNEKKYFHYHESIEDQKELIYEISKYHAGWIIDNTFEILKMITSYKNIEFRELALMFRLSTVSSSLMALVSAGLPIFLNRTMTYITTKLPKEYFISLEDAEIKNFRKIISNIDWDDRYKVLNKRRIDFTIENNIKKLIFWLEKFM